MRKPGARKWPVLWMGWGLGAWLLSLSGLADECPYAVLRTNSNAETALGAWELQARSPRMDFPNMQDKGRVQCLRPGVWGMPVPCGASIAATGKSLDVRVAGYQGFPEADGWIPMVAFTPKAAGKYAISGQLKIWFNGDPNAKDAVQWAVVTAMAESAFKPLAGDKVGNGAVVKMSEQASLQAVELAAGETVGILLWRPANRNVCGGSLTGLAVAPTPAPAAAK